MQKLSTCLGAVDHLADESKPLLLATGFDGTLCPFAETPSSVVVPAIIIELIGNMISSGVVMAVISGRSLEDLMDRLPCPVIFAGNHGLRIQGRGVAFEHAGARALRPVLSEACQELHQAIGKWEGAFVEDKYLTAAVHYATVESHQRYDLILTVRHCLAKYGSALGLRMGRAAIEIHPRVEWNKGACLTWIKEETGLKDHCCICIGDDPTDESMFAANSGHLNFKVGLAGRSVAGLRLSDVSEVAALLAHLERAVRPRVAH